MTARDACRRAAESLRDVSGRAAEQEAAWLLEAVVGDRRAAQRDRIDSHDLERFDALVLRRRGGEPLQYLTGVAGFRRLELQVGRGVFIPRPETELVAECAMRCLPPRGTLVDVGTGSGAIALSVADERPDARVIATERAAAARAWARRNIAATGLPVTLVGGDLFEELSSELLGGVDVVVSNPPYVAPDEAASLPPEVARHEPREALFAPHRGVATIARLVEDAPRWLRREGALVIEIAETQAAAVTELLHDRGYDNIDVRDDLTGRPRIAEARSPLG